MGQVRIREAITEAFTVRDQRGKMQHLEKITEGGKFHKALIENNIRLGSDLKLMYETDPDKLKMILGCSKWGLEVIGQHGPRVLDDANSIPSRSQEAEANDTITTCGPPFGQLHLVNAQFIPSNDSHQPHSTVRYSPDDNLRTESFQNNSNGLYGQQNSDGVPFDPDNYFDWTN
ncbi:hypothetical protein Dsin_032959 [Dipteronia sinensis]|nr:hypothetical protein Dsin_032959 [Dipteronia sinensis]